jgi:signal transduction histidine kinase/CheY-like chemotaxis protein
MSPSHADGTQLRVLVRGATARDDSMTVRELSRASILARSCPDLGTMLADLRAGAGALLLAEECLSDPGAQALFQHVSGQPPWSDLPVLILARQGANSTAISDALALGFNVTVLERPIRVAALISAVRSALRGRRRQYELRDLLDGLHESDQRKTEFLATLAHELRNPLAPIRSCVGILQRNPEDPKPVLEVMERQVHHMVRLVDDLLELSRITRGKVELRPEHVELATIIRAACETSRPLMDAGRHRFEQHLPAQPLWLRADPVRLAQVLSNLLNNAARYTDPGGRITLEARADGREAVVTVSDNGMGLSEDLLPGVFDMFSQADGRDIRAQHGLGIGLALVRNLVEMHGGQVSAHSEGPGRGSQFEVRLPLAPAPRARAGGDAGDAVEEQIAQRILVVDDNRDAADSLATLLGLAGADVEVAYDGAEALEKVETFQPEVAVLDLGMPGMSGLDVARRIRDRPDADDCTLIALTGWGQDSDRALTRDAGFAHHLTKPVDFDEMRAVLSSLR